MNDPHENATWVYNYDRGGNILSKVRYAYTTGTVGTAVETIPYAYGDANWKDKLTAYNGTAITYDAIGNPLNDGSWTYEWAVGRQLKKMSRDGQSLTFKYDHNGMRIQKVLEHSWYPETTNYTYHGKLLTHMEVAYTDFDEVGHVDKLHFFYDAQSRPAKVRFNGTIYTYVQNLQGDIVGILDNTGNLVVEYKYDAWGKPLSTTGSLADTLGIRNPFRYRGYVFDEESGLYYLGNRYYLPVRGRFMNADMMIARKNLLLHNVFAYAKNMPIIRLDASGLQDIIYTAKDQYTTKGADDGVKSYFIEYKNDRYPANSEETATLYDWDTVIIDFMDEEFDQLIDEKASYASVTSVFSESIGGKLDFKCDLEKKHPTALYLIEGCVYNRNELGNFMWAYYLEKHGYPTSTNGILAQAGSLLRPIITAFTQGIFSELKKIRFDEPWDQRARRAGVSYYYKRYPEALYDRLRQ